MKPLSKIFDRSVLLGMACALLSACGPTAFGPGVNTESQTAAGGLDLAPKVDIVMGISGGGAIRNIFPGVQSEMPSFLTELEKTGWNYRFVAVPLHKDTPLTGFSLDGKVSVSKHDTRYYRQSPSSWISPFPGADPNDSSLGIADRLFSGSFVYPTTATSTSGDETGIQAYRDLFNLSDVSNFFLRPDAHLAVVTISSEEDRSGAVRNMGINGEYFTYPNSNFIAESLAQVQAKKQTSELVKFYSVVAGQLNCRSSLNNARPGTRYQQIAQLSGGESLDLCANDLKTSLANVAKALTKVRISYTKRFLILRNPPKVETLRVYKTSGGKEVQLQASNTDGFQYVGKTTQYTIEKPIPMGYATGYMIELFGSAKLIGEDSARVEYVTEGSQFSK